MKCERKINMQKYNDKKNLFEDMNVFFAGNNIFKIKDLKTDIIEEKDKYIIEIEVPGVEKENINIKEKKINFKICLFLFNITLPFFYSFRIFQASLFQNHNCRNFQ